MVRKRANKLVKKLVKKMASIEIAPQPNFRNPKRRAIAGGGFSEAMPRATQSIRTLPTGTVLVKDNELWYTVNGFNPPNIQTAPFLPGQSGLVRLDQVASMYELWRIRRCIIHYYTATGFNQNGMLHVGVDFDATDTPSSVEGVSVLRPGFRGPIYMENQSMVLDVSRINRARWMYTKAGPSNHQDTSIGFLIASSAAYASLTTQEPVGELYCEYEIEFSGPVTPTEVPGTIMESKMALTTIITTPQPGTVDDPATWTKRDYAGIIPQIVRSPLTPLLGYSFLNAPSYTVAHWIDLTVTLSLGLAYMGYQVAASLFSTSNRPQFGVIPMATVGSVLKSVTDVQGDTDGSFTSAMLQVVTDKNGNFSVKIPISCDHFPTSSEVDLPLSLQVASMGASRLPLSWYAHTDVE